jgi:NAD(P)-dependent dehydrogenase (short-subunit alcohol dehydrogenase family)
MKKEVMNMRLENKITVITGAGSGLGRGIALVYAGQGAVVVAVDRELENGQRTVGEIESAGGKAIAIQGDISSEEDVRRVFREIMERYGRLDVLVNNAGITGRSIGDGPAADCVIEAWDTIMGINLRGTFLCSKYGLQLMVPQGSGVIVNVSSVLGLVGCQEHFTSHAYQTTKAGIIGLTRSIAAYYAKFGIRANVLAPGLIESNATAKVKTNEELMTFIRRMQPLGELGTPEDAAMAAVYLGSEESRFVTGQVLAVDGGWTMQ